MMSVEIEDRYPPGWKAGGARVEMNVLRTSKIKASKISAEAWKCDKETLTKIYKTTQTLKHSAVK